MKRNLKNHVPVVGAEGAVSAGVEAEEVATAAAAVASSLTFLNIDAGDASRKRGVPCDIHPGPYE